MDTGSTISVLLVNFNGKGFLPGLFASLAAQSRAADEVILVDNASSDGSVEEVRAKWPWVRLLVAERNLGFAGGNNVAAAAARGDYLALVNTDATLAPDWLAAAAAALDADDAVAAVVGKVYLGNQPPLLESAGAEFDNVGISWGRGVNELDRGQFEEAAEVASLTGCAMMVRRQALGGQPLFDPRLFMYYEDFELALRLRGGGHRLRYVPAAVACHERTGSVRRAWDAPRLRQLGYANRNRAKILAKHYPVGVLLRSLPLIALSFAYAQWRIVHEGGVRAGLSAAAAQARFAIEGIRERWHERHGAAAARWLPWMTRHGLRDLLALRSRLGTYVRLPESS